MQRTLGADRTTILVGDSNLDETVHEALCVRLSQDRSHDNITRSDA